MEHEYKGLLQDVCANPDDAAPRLIMADWLEDHGSRSGDKERAEFIRLQIWMHKRSEDGLTTKDADEWVRTEEILRLYRRAWLEHDCPTLLQEFWNDPGDYSYVYECDWERGFVWRITCSLDAWFKEGRQIVKTIPVTYVANSGGHFSAHLTVMGEDPFYFAWICWEGAAYDCPHNHLPSQLFQLLDGDVEPINTVSKRYKSVGDANAAYSRAMIKWAKQKVDGA